MGSENTSVFTRDAPRVSLGQVCIIWFKFKWYSNHAFLHRPTETPPTNNSQNGVFVADFTQSGSLHTHPLCCRLTNTNTRTPKIILTNTHGIITWTICLYYQVNGVARVWAYHGFEKGMARKISRSVGTFSISRVSGVIWYWEKYTSSKLRFIWMWLGINIPI